MGTIQVKNAFRMVSVVVLVALVLVTVERVAASAGSSTLAAANPISWGSSITPGTFYGADAYAETDVTAQTRAFNISVSGKMTVTGIGTDTCTMPKVSLFVPMGRSGHVQTGCSVNTPAPQTGREDATHTWDGVTIGSFDTF